MTLQRTDAQRASTAYTTVLNRVRNGAPVGVNPTSAATDPAATSPTNATQAGAVITLSPSAKLFAKALASAQFAPDVRADRVAAVRARLAQNPSSVDIESLAAKMLGDAPHA